MVSSIIAIFILLLIRLTHTLSGDIHIDVTKTIIFYYNMELRPPSIRRIR
jgi:hypothetical protein